MTKLLITSLMAAAVGNYQDFGPIPYNLGITSAKPHDPERVAAAVAKRARKAKAQAEREAKGTP